MKQLIKKIKQISILLLVISFAGCENDDALVPKVDANFTHTINAYTGTVTFINTSVNSRNYFWTFGDGTSSTEINPIKTYTNGEYKVTLKAINVAGASDTFEDTLTINIIDVGTPVITLLGDATINILVGDTFTDEGATATDDVDGDITANIVVAGDAVDVNTEGTYTITYNVSDAYGNAATEVTRTVIVAADVVAPVITLIGSATINMMVGDAFTDEGATATDDIDGDITANIVVAGDAVDVNTAGTYIITYNVSDDAGNAATEVTRTVIVATVPVDGAYFYSTAGTVDIASVWGDWGTGTAQDGAYDQDATYNPSIKLSGGSWGALIAFTQFPAGTLAQYGNLELKIKTDEAEFKIKVPEEEIVFAIADGTPLEGGWVQMSIPLSTWSTGVIDAAMEFAIWGSGGTTLYLTDVILTGEGSGGGGGGGGTALTVAAPTPPARDAANVISIFSNQYADIPVTEWSTSWDSADIEDVQIDGNDTKKITYGDFLGIDFVANSFDATDMTHFHIDYYIDEDVTGGEVFLPKLSNHTGGAGETNALLYTDIVTADRQRTWFSLDIPLASFDPQNGSARDNISQLILGTGASIGTLYVDNIYLYK